MSKNDKEIFGQTQKESIAAILFDLREQRGITQKELADYLHLTFGTISHYETGITVPPLEVIYKLAAFYNVSADYLLNRCASKVDYTQTVDIKLSSDMTIGDAIEVLKKLPKSEKEHFVYFLKLATQKNNEK